MIDLHTHTFFSDGVLSPSELVYRAKIAGYKAIAITDHSDESNFEQAIKNILKVKKNLTKAYGIKVFAGCELTYVPPKKESGASPFFQYFQQSDASMLLSFIVFSSCIN